MGVTMFVGAGLSLDGPRYSAWDVLIGNQQAYEVKYTPGGLRQIRNEIAHLSHVRASLAAEDHTSWANLQVLCGTNMVGIGWNGLSFQQSSIPDDWYRTGTSWPGFAGGNARPANPWAPLVSSNLGVLVMDGLDELLGAGGHDEAQAAHGRSCRCHDCVARALERTRQSKLRLVGMRIATLSFVLVRVVAALSQRITAANLVLLLIAACRRFGHRDEPGDDDALRVRRYLSLPGTVPAM